MMSLICSTSLVYETQLMSLALLMTICQWFTAQEEVLADMQA
jgi:hypothetical protein